MVWCLGDGGTRVVGVVVRVVVCEDIRVGSGWGWVLFLMFSGVF